MAILINLAWAGLLLLLQSTQAKNIQAALSANIGGYIPQESLLAEIDLYNQGHSITIHFDDVPTDAGTGIGTISTYSYLIFSNLATVNTLTAASLGSISVYETDCASSQPNALFSARARDGHKERSSWVADITKLHSAGLSSFFNLEGLSVKRLGEVPRGLILEIIAWEIRDSEAQNMYNTWIAYNEGGQQDIQYYGLTVFGRFWGETASMFGIVIQAPDEEQEEVDWAFCLNDLDVEFLDR